MIFNYFKKYIAASLILLILCSSLFSLSIKQSEAYWPTVEMPGPSLAANIITAQAAITSTAKESILDTVAYMLVKILLSTMTNSIVNWINTGFEGNPSFVQDIGGFLKDAANQASGAFINQLGMEGLLCSQFRPQLIFSLKYSVPEMERFRCTLKDAVSNWEGFMKDFNQGGWKGWLKMTAEPQNNPWGAYLMSQDEIAKKKAEAQKRQETELNWGSGFLSLKKCEGGGSQEDFCDDQCASLEGDDEAYDDCVNGCNDTEISTSELCGASGGKMENTTPGAIIADQLKVNLGSSARQMELADEIGESLAAIFNALIQQLVSKGLASLSDKSDKNWSNTSPSDEEKNSALKAIDSTLIYEKQYRDAKQNTIGLFDDIIANLEKLKQCYKDQISIIRTQFPVDQMKIDFLQNKIDYEIQPKINDYKNKKTPFENAVESSNTVINEAEEIRLGIISTTTYTEFGYLIEKYEEIRVTLHVDLDVQNAQQEYRDIKDQINSENARINTEYNQCVADLSGF